MDKHLIVPILLLAVVLYTIVKRPKQLYNIILIAIICLMPFYQSFFHYRHFVLITAGTILYRGGKEELTKYRNIPVVRSMILFFLLTLLSAVFSKYPALTVTPIIDLAFFYCFFITCLASFNKQDTINLTAKALAVTLIASVLVQTMQLLGFEAFYLYDPEKLNTNTGLVEGSENVIVRFWGTFGNSLTFSSYLSIIGTFLFIYYHRSQNKKTNRISYLILGFATYSILLTAGRTALMALFIGLFSYCFLINWKKTTLISLGIFLLVFIFSNTIMSLLIDSGLGTVSRFTNSDSDKDFRLELWTRGFSLFMNNPLLGAGPGNLTMQLAPIIKPVYEQSSESLTVPWGHVENTYLSVLYTFGVLGFACFSYMLYKSFNYCYSSIRISASKSIKDVSYSMVCTWVVIYINMISNPVFVTDYRLISLILFFVAFSLHIRMSSKAQLNNLMHRRELQPITPPVVLNV